MTSIAPPLPPGGQPGAAPGGRDWKFGSPFARLFVYPNGQGEPVYIPTTRVEIHSTEYQHEVAICYVKRDPANERLLCRHLPGYIQYGRLPQQWNTMVGYVANQEPARVGVDPEGEFAVFFIGPTWKLKEPRPFTWSRKTADRIIREIAQYNRLAADVVLGTIVWNWATATADETQWEFLVRLCQRSGMTLVPRRTEIFARRRDDITRADIERAEFFYEGMISTLNVTADPAAEPGHYQRPTDDVGDDGSVGGHYVRPSAPPPEQTIIEQLCGRTVDHYSRPPAPPGTTSDQTLPTHAVEGVQPYTRPPVPQGLVPADPVEALMAARRAEAFPVNALCITTGSAKVQAGKVLRLEPAENSAWSGLWYIKSAWHVFQGQYGTGIPDRNHFVRPGSSPPPDYTLRMEIGDRDLPDPINARPADEDAERSPRPPRGPRTPRPDRTPGDRPGRPGQNYPGNSSSPPQNPPGDTEPGHPPPGTQPDQPILIPTNPPVTTLPPDDGAGIEPGTVDYTPQPISLSDTLPGPTCPLPPARVLPSEWTATMIADPGPAEREKDYGPALVI